MNTGKIEMKRKMCEAHTHTLIIHKWGENIEKRKSDTIRIDEGISHEGKRIGGLL